MITKEKVEEILERDDFVDEEEFMKDSPLNDSGKVEE